MMPNDAPTAAPLVHNHRTLLTGTQQRERELDRRLAWIGYVRFGLAMTMIVLVLLAVVDRLGNVAWFLPPLVGFAALSILTELVKRNLHKVRHSAAYHERALARLEDRWAGTGVSGIEYLKSDHPYAGDLDLFGKGSLYERLCVCATEAGRSTLARWLLTPASPEEIRRRQEAVRELVGKEGWRERAFVLGADVRSRIATAVLETWGNVPVNPSRRLRIVAPVLVLFTFLAVVGWIARLWPPILVGALLVIQATFAAMLLPHVQRALKGLDRRSRDLFQLAALLQSLEGEPFVSAHLRALQDSLRSAGAPPSQRLRQLARLIELLDQPHNFLFALIAPFLLWTTQIALAIEAWRQRTGAALGRWLPAIGEVEALSSLAAYAAENPDDPFPEMAEGLACFRATELGHPLLPRARCVTNSLALDSQRRLLIVSGSNMSGKSTLLRAVGINAVLAQMGAPVRAKALCMSRLAVGATLRIQDSLQEGKSRFYAEITRLRTIVDLATGPLPLLFLLDEILQGTNSHERKIGAEAIVKGLLERDTIGLVTTHDLALTQLAEDLTPVAANCHFGDDWVDGELHFDYRLRDGPVTKSNALALMRAVGLKVD
jgi:MutS domain V